MAALLFAMNQLATGMQDDIHQLQAHIQQLQGAIQAESDKADEAIAALSQKAADDLKEGLNKEREYVKWLQDQQLDEIHQRLYDQQFVIGRLQGRFDAEDSH